MFGDKNWLIVIILGGFAGALAKLLMPGKDPGGCIITILLGIAGALLGTWLRPNPSSLRAQRAGRLHRRGGRGIRDPAALPADRSQASFL